MRFKGRERDDVEEYCVSEGWIRAPVGKTRDRKGNLLTIRLTGPVEPYYLTPSDVPTTRVRSSRPGSPPRPAPSTPPAHESKDPPISAHSRR